jgi:hypothetical protein
MNPDSVISIQEDLVWASKQEMAMLACRALTCTLTELDHYDAGIEPTKIGNKDDDDVSNITPDSLN